MFTVISKIPIGEDRLEVSIRQENPYVFIVTQITNDKDGDDAKVIDAVLEEFYQDHYRERARKEAIEKVEAVAEAAKQKAEEAMPVLVDGNTFATMIAGEMIANDRNLWPGQYKALLEFIPEAVPGQKYANGQYIKVKDTKATADAQSGQFVCVRLNKGDEWEYDGTDILSVAQPYKNGFDIRRYESYPRVKLGTATDTKISK